MQDKDIKIYLVCSLIAVVLLFATVVILTKHAADLENRLQRVETMLFIIEEPQK